jgi:chemotaxis protein methyltransferase CheR
MSKVDSGSSEITLEYLINHVSKIVSGIIGIQLGDKQKAMVESRLKKRMLELNLNTPQDYYSYLNANTKNESNVLVSILTTHHTKFFREFFHFEYLEKEGLAKAISRAKKEGRKVIHIWSAACSMGHEVYSLSMFLSYHLKQMAPDFDFKIFGSDIDTESVEVAKNGVYRWDDVKEIPATYMGDHWARGSGEIAEFVKAKKTIKSHCDFGVVNLLNISHDVGSHKFDIIFCRNVFIYFSEENIKKITMDLLSCLNNEGLFFVGISETLQRLNLPLSYLGPSIYSKIDEKKDLKKDSISVASTIPDPSINKPIFPDSTAAVTLHREPIRVLCVDDSSTILTLLKQILKKEDGFEVVGTAVNGIEASEQLKKLKPDVLTLDIHMPQQTGLEYLTKNFSSSHPPVVMVSSVSRENANLAIRCLEAGAADYVEKPAMSNLKEKGNEIRMKLRCAVKLKQQGAGVVFKKSLALEKSFATSFDSKNIDNCLVAILANVADRRKISELLKEQSGIGFPSLVFFEGVEAILGELSQTISASTGLKVQSMGSELPKMVKNDCFFADYKWFKNAKTAFVGRKTAILILGEISKDIVVDIKDWKGFKNARLIIEDLRDSKSESYLQLKELADDLVPFTSFCYLAEDFFRKK